MNLRTKILFLCIAGFAGASFGADGFERYRVILSRMPFGEAPPEPVAEAPPPTPPAESFAKHLRVCSITEESDSGRVRVGIVDNQTQKSFVFSEGEIVDEIELVSASLADEEAVLRKGQEIVRINLVSGEMSAVTGDQLAAGRAARTAIDATALQSYRDRRQARQDLRRQREEREQERLERQREAAELASRYTPEELRSRLQDYNMEVIRAGMPALPIELTPDQDAQLVAENILPPADGSAPLSAIQPAQPMPAPSTILAQQQPVVSQPAAWQAPTAPETYETPPLGPAPGRVDSFDAALLEELNRLRLEELLEQQALEEALEIGF